MQFTNRLSIPLKTVWSTLVRGGGGMRLTADSPEDHAQTREFSNRSAHTVGVGCLFHVKQCRLTLLC